MELRVGIRAKLVGSLAPNYEASPGDASCSGGKFAGGVYILHASLQEGSWVKAMLSVRVRRHARAKGHSKCSFVS